MAKDPAFLFYSKDWIEGTAELLPAEKGVYIDLLAHQHQKGFIPSDIIRIARIVGLSVIEFEPIWNHLKTKFVSNEDGTLVNKRLQSEVTCRKDKGHKNKIIGHFALLIRKSNLTISQKESIKKMFNIDEFLPFSTDIVTERLTEWFNGRLPSLEDGNGNGNGNASTVFSNGEGQKFSLEHCRRVALLDEIWVMNVKPTQTEMDAFDKHLIGTADTEKTIVDYKSHFFNWRKKQKFEPVKEYSRSTLKNNHWQATQE